MFEGASAQRIENEADDAGYFGLRPTAGEADFCSRAGAQALKDKIEAYWRARGETVLVALHNVGFHPAIRAARYDVRSDMINGMPRTNAAPRPRIVADDEDAFS